MFLSRFTSDFEYFDFIKVCCVAFVKIHKYNFNEMSRAGRPKNQQFDLLKFDLIKSNNKYSAFCRICKKEIQNTAEKRLIGHRNVRIDVAKSGLEDISNSNAETSASSNKEDNIIYILLDDTKEHSDQPGTVASFTDLEIISANKNKNVFRTLFEKKIKKSLVFWSMAEMKQPQLSMLAKKLLLIPASSAQIERLFSSWGHVHSSDRNRLTFERSEKLVHLYHSLRIDDENNSDSDVFDFDDDTINF